MKCTENNESKVCLLDEENLGVQIATPFVIPISTLNGDNLRKQEILSFFLAHFYAIFDQIAETFD